MPADKLAIFGLQVIWSTALLAVAGSALAAWPTMDAAGNTWAVQWPVFMETLSRNGLSIICIAGAATLFAWAAASLALDDRHGYRDIETAAYCGALTSLMVICLIGARDDGRLLLVPVLGMSLLFLSAFASLALGRGQTTASDSQLSRDVARAMALESAMLSLRDRRSRTQGKGSFN